MKKIFAGILILLVVGFFLASFFKSFRLEFHTGPCLGDSASQSKLGVREVEWLNNKNLRIKAYANINCGARITNADYQLAGDTILLKYSWKYSVFDIHGTQMVAYCFCAQELNYLLKNLEKKNYKFKLVEHEERPLLTVIKERINKWLLGE